MNYALGYALNARDIFQGFDAKRIKTHWKDCMKVTGTQSKKTLAAKIFTSAIQLAMEDVINNSDTFEFPKGTNDAQIYIEGVDGDRFIEERKRGRHKGIDYLETNFTGYNPVFKYQRAGYKVTKPVYLDPEHKQQIVDRANSGKSYY